jgi:hypothetical protein
MNNGFDLLIHDYDDENNNVCHFTIIFMTQM